MQSQSGIRDNHHRGTVADFLRQHIHNNAHVSIVSAYFTIYAYYALKEQFDTIEHLDFLFGEPSFISKLDPSTRESKTFTLTDNELMLQNVLTQRATARACAEWIRQKVSIKSITQHNLMHGKMYYVQNGPVNEAIMGSSNFTVRGLGISESNNNYELNLIVDSNRDRTDLKAWFDHLWQHTTLVKDVKADVLAYLQQLYSDASPEFIYYKTLFHIFEKFINSDDATDKLLRSTSLLETQIWKTLFDFQKDGVKGVINKIQNYNGCIIADSVGLGKTFEALAVIKYYELKNERVLVLCPKKLRENWVVYTRNDQLNPFIDDRFRFDVLSHTDIGRERGTVGVIDLATLNWSNYDLVVIDESHNFRNNLVGTRDAQGQLRKSRYSSLMEDIIKAGIKTKVLLLSATPVNNDLQDLRNQITLMAEGSDTAFAQSIGVVSLKSVMGEAQKAFTQWSKQANHTVDQLLNQLPSAFFRILDELTIARSRAHIIKYYNTSAQTIAFPQRQRPISIAPKIDIEGFFPSYQKINTEIEGYKLAIFSPSQYLLPQYQSLYKKKGNDPFSQGDREHYLIGMMKVNFLKRLESSVASFALTLSRTIHKIDQLKETIARFKNQQTQSTVDVTITDDVEDDELGDAMNLTVGKLQFKLAHLRLDDWLIELERDRDQLIGLYNSARQITPQRDAKMYELQRHILQKLQHPTITKTGKPNRKVIIFTAFADTAKYLYANLHQWCSTQGAHVALVCGGGDTQTTFGHNEFSHILTNFAPIAKQRNLQSTMPQHGEIDVLIATDCISEGQNLQDADLLINYDIHWNPVRIIQRFGRIDRIGSLNTHISMINFWPTDDLNAYINLRNRVESRMALVDITATGQDNPLQPQETEAIISNEMGFRDKQLLKLIDSVIDIDDEPTSVSLTDFTLDDFRRELLTYLKINQAALQQAPLGLYAVTHSNSAHPHSAPGVVFCLRQRDTNTANDMINPLQPYFLVYIRNDGNVRYNFVHPKQVLDLLRAVSSGQNQPHQQLCQLFDTKTNHGQNMQVYSELLKRALRSIHDTFQKRIANGVTLSRSFVIPPTQDQVQSDADFELITWMVLYDNE